MDNKNRILLFFALSMALLFVARRLSPPPPPPDTKAPEAPAASTTETPAPAGVSPGVGPIAVPDVEIQAVGAEPDIVVENDFYIATLSNVGAILKSLRLKGFRDSHGGIVELVNGKAAAVTGWPLALDAGEPMRNALLAGAKFKGEKIGATVVYEWSVGGLYARKELKFDTKTYTFSLETRLVQDGTPVSHWVQWLGGFGDNEVRSGGILCWMGWGSCDDILRQVVVESIPADPLAADAPIKFERIQPEEASPQKTVEGQSSTPAVGPSIERTTTRVGMEDQFFLLMMTLPGNAVSRLAKTFVEQDGYPINLIGISVPMQQGAIQIYAGPKDKRVLEKMDPKLSGVVDYGMFWFITVPLGKALMWVHGYVGNYGWAIIFLTLGINLALFPLRLKQQLSMQKLQKIQPQMRTLQDKFKKLKPGDPRRNEIQSEIMGLYKEHGVNPLGGCLPLLLQLPFLWGFYNVLSTSIELRRAPWALWIQDLSQRDPYFVMPILMSVSMYAMQKMTPTATGADPAQQRMMAIMPFMMGLLFLTYPSGLMVYWLTSNVIGIAQQILITKYWPSVQGASGKS
jgi:YidC/Oxa1 family membrane protein insertase